MKVILKQDVNRVRNGYSARSPVLGLTANGVTPEIAKRNLERLVLLYLKPFEREGSLRDELAAVGLENDAGDGDLVVAVED